MGIQAAFFNGVRLWQNAKLPRMSPAVGNEARKVGLSRTRGLIAPRSLNFTSVVTIFTYIPPIDSGMAGAKSSFSGMNRSTTRWLYTLKSFERYVDQSGTFGHIAWVEDEDEVLTVSGGPYSGGVEPVLVTGSGWTPTVGDLALFCDPATGDGRVIPVIGYSGGAITGDYKKDTLVRDKTTGLPITEDWAVLSGMKVYKVQFYWPRSMPMQAEDPVIPSAFPDEAALDLQWRLASESEVQYPTSVAFDFT